MIREPMAAGTFYAGSRGGCEAAARRLIEQAELPGDLPTPLYGGLVPHAGWAFSGRLAATTLKALTTALQPQTIVLLGADHTGRVRMGEVFDSGAWRTPLGDVPVDEALAGELLAEVKLFRSNPQAHGYEHSLEVQIPLLQMLLEDVRIVPVSVPPTEQAVQIGQEVGRKLRDKSATVVGSTDLTHHAGHFPAPGGRGEQGVLWTEQNDRRMLDLIEKMQAEQIVAEAAAHGNACGAGAVAATVAACRALGAKSGRVLGYTNSYRVIHATHPNEPDDTTVGYASVVFA